MPLSSQVKEILAPLSREQSAVVTHKGGHALVSAVAGSGKTHTLIQRVLFLLHNGVNKDRILIVMYNRDVKEDFAKRLKAACQPYNFVPPKVFTYHSLGRKICERLVKRGDLPPGGYLLDDFSYRHHLYQAIERAAEEQGAIDFAYKDNEYISEFLGLIDTWKGDLLQPKEVANSVDYEQIHPVLKDAYRYFEELRREEGYRTFVDMIYDPAIAIRDNPQVDAWVGNRYEHILIDEYQDINLAQQELIQSVAGTKAQVMAVGDEDQCIYEWRGSRPDYMTGLFESFFTGAKTYTLSSTYRFGHLLSCVANAVMYQNKKRTKKLCISASNTPRTVVEIFQQNDKPEERLLAKIVQQWIGQGRRYDEIVILVRSWAMGLEPEIELMAAGVPCVMGDQKKSYKSRPEIQALIGLMSLGLPQKFSFFDDKEKRVEIIDAMLRFAELFLKRAQRKDLAISLAEDASGFGFILSESSKSPKIGSKVKQQLISISEMWKELSSDLNPQMSVGEAFNKVVATTDFKLQILKGHVQKQAASDAIRAVDILIEHAENKGFSLETLLTELDRVAPVDETDAGVVVITSVHKSKGCEWPMVIIPKLEEGRFPHVEGEADKDDIEEERRLFYVAITRAIEGLALIAPQDEFLVKWLRSGYFGSPSKGEMLASRFLYETGYLRAQSFCSQIYQAGAQDSIQVGDKEFLYKNYLRRMQGRA